MAGINIRTGIITGIVLGVALFSTTAVYALNLFQNPSFENGDFSSWSDVCTTTFGVCTPGEFTHGIISGKNNSSYLYKAELINASLGMSGYTQSINQAIDAVIGDTQYVISFDAKTVDTTVPAGVTLWFYEDNGAGGFDIISSASTNLMLVLANTRVWDRYVAVFTTPPTAIRVRVLMRYASGGAPFNGELYWDSFGLESCVDHNADSYNLVVDGSFENGNPGNVWSTSSCTGGGCTLVGDTTTPDGYCGNSSFKIDLLSNGEAITWKSTRQTVTGLFPSTLR